MIQAMDMPSDEITTLRRCVRDLVALTTLPAVWNGYSPQAIAESLSDVLLSMLHLDMVYIRVERSEIPLELVRTPQQLYPAEKVAEIGGKLGLRESIQPGPPRSIPNPLGDGNLHIAAMPIGHEGLRDVIVIGAQSYTVLTDTELLLLRVAANQAAIALQQAQLLLDLKNANELKDQLLVQEQNSRRQAEQAIQARDEFLSVAAHELKTPVTSLRGFAQSLLRQFEKKQTVEPERVKRALHVINQQSVKLTTLLSQLLDISRVEAGRLVLNQAQTDVVALVRSVAAMIQGLTERHTISVTSPESLTATIDVLRVEQVLVNLLDNAVKFSPDGGSIDIEVLTPDSHRVQIAVTDRGLGIPVERRDHIFDRFYQAHDPGFGGGMGLGLYISRQIAELHGGTLEAVFPEEGGTRFIVSLPVGTSSNE
jgi:signal transduction histidine kinase